MAIVSGVNIPDNKRVETNRIWLKGEIKDEVVRQIRKSMPTESGGVNVGNK